MRALKSFVSVDKLISSPLIFTKKGAITQDYVDLAFASKAHFPEPNICLDGRFEPCHVVHLGRGFAFVANVPKDEGLAQVPIKEKPNETTEHICWLRSRSNVQGIRDLWIWRWRSVVRNTVRQGESHLLQLHSLWLDS